MVVLQVHTGREVFVADCLNAIGVKAIAPRQIVQERKGGIWSEFARLLFPGYIFIDMRIDDKTYYRILRIDGTLRFLNKCQCLPPHEVGYIKQIDIAFNDEICDVIIMDDGHLKILNGWLKVYNDKVVGYNRRQRRLYLEITIHGEPVRLKCSVNFKSQAQADVG